MVVALLMADVLHSPREIVTTTKRVRAESCLETGINLMLGCSLQIQASKARLDASQKLKTSLQRWEVDSWQWHNRPQQLHLHEGEIYLQNEGLKSQNNHLSSNRKWMYFQGNILRPQNSVYLFHWKLPQAGMLQGREKIHLKENNYFGVLESGKETYFGNICSSKANIPPPAAPSISSPESTQSDCRNTASSGAEEWQNKQS